MSREGDLMRRALRKRVLPLLAGMGFVGKTAHFQRRSELWLDLLTIQFHHHGGSFLLECGRTRRGDFQTHWGPLVPEAELEVAYLHRRARLIDQSEFGWFAFAGFGEDLALYDAVAQRVAGLLPQLDDWLTGQGTGSAIQAHGPAV
ncbi:hypothetical protein SAMN02745857_00860 [Andreprevotia lacus DSM 23236]|jgi:hypothetical protein|uniref:Uncharacterized protein n=1 Tax=Andreprevotia lacus DSM 23236 TaxID=1121001 RepID=A0A1W1X9K4_9NEIS|nr:DUF4304 domain-containing protein [Andreprevotia lacus]SMC20201.1 hypothetical protein SAMN02745857_00860 [Andreprevotia lacus DSM 23236]